MDVSLSFAEYGSSSDSDREELLVDQAFRPDNDSDAESIDSDQEDPLK
jgi:KAT8 regulatory NSL complex subunit 2